MSGHSKWATIHRQKGVNDAKKGAIFTKIGKMITLAVRQGKGLALALEKAKQYNMPKENIQRAMEKQIGGEEEATFEVFLPGRVAVMVHCLTDNKLRTGQEVRQIIEKNGGTMGSIGSVSYMFDDNHEPHEWAKTPGTEETEVILEKLDDLDDVQDIWTTYA